MSGAGQGSPLHVKSLPTSLSNVLRTIRVSGSLQFCFMSSGASQTDLRIHRCSSSPPARLSRCRSTSSSTYLALCASSTSIFYLFSFFFFSFPFFTSPSISSPLYYLLFSALLPSYLPPYPFPFIPISSFLLLSRFLSLFLFFYLLFYSFFFLPLLFFLSSISFTLLPFISLYSYFLFSTIPLIVSHIAARRRPIDQAT